ncbi:hypothetical protein REPUB_Repub15cG0102500 [Reevesia pubescens]
MVKSLSNDMEVSLEEVHVLAWHQKLFKSIGDSWGKFIKMDKDTATRRRFDVARILVSVESRMNIPSSFSINIRGKTFRVLVTIEDGGVEAFNAPSSEVDTATGSRGNGEERGMGSSIYDDVDRFDDCSWVLKDYQQSAICKSRDLLIEEHDGLQASCMPPKSVEIFENLNIARKECSHSGPSNESLGLRLIHNLELNQSFSRPTLREGDINFRLCETSPGNILCYSPGNSHFVSYVANSELSGAHKSLMPKLLEFPTNKGSQSKKKSKLIVRKRRQVIRKIRELLEVGRDTELCSSQRSVSDEGFANRNADYFQEAQEIWKVSKAFGLQFEDMILLQETKLQQCDDRLIKQLWGNNSGIWEFSGSVGSAGGLISIWKEDFFTIETKIINQRYMLLTGVLNQFNVRCGMGNIYAPNDDGEREILWEELATILSNSQVNWCIGGDFNIVKNLDEKSGLVSNYSAMELFSSFIADGELLDLPIIGDHNPVMLNAEWEDWGPKPFKFFNYWLEEDGFNKLVEDAWNTSVTSNQVTTGLWGRLRLLKPTIKQ